MGLEILKENTKAWRAKKAETQQASNKTNGLQAIINGALKTGNSAAAAAASGSGEGQLIGGGNGPERGFQCTSCKRKLLYEAKFQCVVCPDVAVCKLCFGVKYHEQHDFLTRP